MSIRTKSLAITASLLCVLAPGASAARAAGASFAHPADLEFAAVPPQPDDSGRPDLFVEPMMDTPGSGVPAGTPDAADADAVDPWADAFAESFRLVSAAGRPDPPVYQVVSNPRVEYFLDRFTGVRRSVVATWLQRSGRYLHMIREVLRGHGLPEDLAFTAMIESGFNPVAVSRAGAKGLWQFMAATARRYGLRVDHWVDERLDPEKSTVAAAAYLRDLYSQFGSWALAQAAYNAGEVRVARAVRITGSTDFWAIARTGHLRQETKEFVPQIHAATMIGREPDRYGFDLDDEAPSPVERVALPPATDLRRLSLASGVSAEMLRRLNPVLVRGVTPPRGTWEVTIPAGTRAGVLAALAPKETGAAARGQASRTVRAAADGAVHVVRPLDTVSAIAKRYGVSVGDVQGWNRLEDADRIRPGDRLRIADLRPSVEHDGQGGFR